MTTEGGAAPWDRQYDAETGEREPLLWYERFCAYLQAERPRIMLDVYRKTKARWSTAKHPSGAWEQAARHWQWKERADAYDLDRVIREKEVWEARSREQREIDWQTSQRLRDRVQQMLMFPLARTVVQSYDDGRERQVVEPVRWRMGDIARVADLSSKLARLATGMDTANVTLTLEVILDALPEEFRGEVRRQLVARLAASGSAAGAEA